MRLVFPRLDALRVALASHEDIDVIRGMCEGGRVPEELRGEVWKVRSNLRISSPLLCLHSLLHLSLPTGVSGCVATPRCPGGMERAPGLRQPGHHTQPVCGGGR